MRVEIEQLLAPSCRLVETESPPYRDSTRWRDLGTTSCPGARSSRRARGTHSLFEQLEVLEDALLEARFLERLDHVRARRLPRRRTCVVLAREQRCCDHHQSRTAPGLHRARRQHDTSPIQQLDLSQGPRRFGPELIGANGRVAGWTCEMHGRRRHATGSPGRALPATIVTGASIAIGSSSLLPAPDGLVLDVGCGEGRLPRDLKERGYDVIGIDASPTLIDAAREADPGGEYRVAEGAALPFADDSIRLITAFMSLHDIDDMAGTLQEIGRVLTARGRLCAAIVHPINSAGRFEERTPDVPFIIRGSYFEARHYADIVERDGLRMTFSSRHRPLEDYVDALARAGLLVERLVEVGDTTAARGARWQRVPLFLHLRAIKVAH